MLKALYTIGYTKKSLADFVGRLRNAGVDCVVDIRLNNTSQLAGFSKRDDLKFLLEEGFGIQYIHKPDFAPTDELLSSYKRDHDWDAYTRGFHKLMNERDMAAGFLDLVKENGWERPCLICSEDKADQCHRRLLAKAVQEACPGLEVIHL